MKTINRSILGTCDNLMMTMWEICCSDERDGRFLEVTEMYFNDLLKSLTPFILVDLSNTH